MNDPSLSEKGNSIAYMLLTGSVWTAIKRTAVSSFGVCVCRWYKNQCQPCIRRPSVSALHQCQPCIRRPLTITTLDRIISEIQRLQNKFIRLALRLPKYISVKLLHDSSGLPYVKDRLFSRATKTLERISANPLVEESISSNKVNPAWDRFPTPLSVIRPVSL